jgi:hypothetical protein
MVINEVSSTDLVSYGIKFIQCPALAFSVAEKTYYCKFVWAESKEELLKELSIRKPLIMFKKDSTITSTPPLSSRIPEKLKICKEVFYTRAWDTLPDRDWSILKNNIVESDNINFTFNWDIDNYTDPIFTAAIRRRENDRKLAAEYDKREIEMALAIKTKKRHPLLNS